jgi:pimeloyl-ACP methyl ester carboxylesterase
MPSVDVNGVEIAYDVAGEGDRACVLLHGFPDTAELWRHQVPALVEAGFRVVTPDLRGYGRSGKPSEVDAYSIPLLAGDVLAVLDDLGIERADVVGHDWGAAVAWAVAAFVPDRVRRLVVLSVGAPGTLLTTYEQREKSWYMLFFQFADAAERWLSNDEWANFRSWARHPDADAVVQQLEANGSLTPALNYYRANIGPEAWVGPPIEFPKIVAPTMGIWSSGDMALTERQMQASSDVVASGFRYERIEGPGHWMQLEAPDAVNALLLDFLGAT